MRLYLDETENRVRVPLSSLRQRTCEGGWSEDTGLELICTTSHMTIYMVRSVTCMRSI